MREIRQGNLVLRLAQDLDNRTLDRYALMLSEFEEGSFKIPSKYEVIRHLNFLAENQLIDHYKVKGEKNDLILFDVLEINRDIEIVSKRIGSLTEIITIYSYDHKVDENDKVPIEIGNIKNLYKIPDKNLNSGPCVYFLCKDNRVVYVGQSFNVYTRIQEHKRNKEYDSIFYIRVSLNEINNVESALISSLKPELNRTKQRLNQSRVNVSQSILNN